MTQTVEAIYGNGVLKPTEPLPFKESVGLLAPGRLIEKKATDKRFSRELRNR